MTGGTEVSRSPDGWDDPGHGYGMGGASSGPRRGTFLQPLIKQMRTYDDLRIRLQKRGGSLLDLGTLAAVLDEVVEVETAYGFGDVKLTDPQGLNKALWDFPDLRIQVRPRRNNFPAFYVCQIWEDHWGQYSLIVRDWYVSPDYPFGGDGRFVQIVDHGRETWFLRLSPFRKAARGLLEEARRDSSGVGSLSTDRLLYHMGRHVLSSAWHEDQAPAIVAARQVRGGLPEFLAALELFYLVLSANLTELRTAGDPRMFRFLEAVYPQKNISRLIRETLPDLDGRSLNDLPRVALGLYARLGQAFGTFLRTEVAWGLRPRPTPFHKVLFANWHVLDRLSARLREESALADAAQRLEKVATGLAAVILD